MSFHSAVLIQKKRDGLALSEPEIRFLVQGFTNGSIPDYQATAFLMATYFKGMTPEETMAFTHAMLASGERYDFSDLSGPKVDKHSTGGIGDKVSLILAPLAAACGLVVPMMAGRGLGHTGGTLDKLEGIEGFQVKLTPERTHAILKEVGCVIIGQSATTAPADRKLYSLRDVTGTVECLPLIVGSILSKKLAEGEECLVLDVKVGSGAFMKTKEQANRLARTLVTVAKKLGLRCRAVLTNMDQPLGDAVGNTLETIECIEMMKTGTGPCDLKEITIQLCAHMLAISGKVKNLPAGRKLATERLKDGSAWKKFQAMVEAQGGSTRFLHDIRLFPKAPNIVPIRAKRKGYITRMNCHEIGQMVVDMGGGRMRAEDSIDHRLGFVFHKKLGDSVRAGDELATAHLPQGADLAAWEARLLAAIEVKPHRKPVPKLILDTIE